MQLESEYFKFYPDLNLLSRNKSKQNFVIFPPGRHKKYSLKFFLPLFITLNPANWPYTTIILLKQHCGFFSLFLTQTIALKTHLIETRRMEHKNALDFYTFPSLSPFSKPSEYKSFLFYHCYAID